ncbi:MAG: hypothetical protein ACP5SC_02825 [Desulfurella sp.]
MSYSVVFLDVPYSHNYYLSRIRNIGETCSVTLSCTSDFNDMRKSIEFAFQNSDGLFIVYSKNLWHKLQKIMLVSFERPSVFKEEAYIVASGFKKLSDGIFSDIVYGKPVVFVPQELDDSFDFSELKKLFNIKSQVIGVFEGNINTQNTIFSDEVLSYIKLENTNMFDSKIQKSKIFTYSAQDCNQALIEVLEKTLTKLSIADLSTNGCFTSKLMSQEKSKNYIALCIDKCPIESLSYFFGIDQKYIEKYGYFSQSIAKEISNALLQFSNSDCSITILNDNQYNRFLFFVLYKDETFDMLIREFYGTYNIIRQKVTNFAILFLREFILSRSL